MGAKLLPMLAYLADGWFTRVGPRRLRAEVLDGAIDSAAWLHQAGTDGELLRPFLLRVRTLTLLLSRPAPSGEHRSALPGDLGQHEREVLRVHLQEASDGDAALQALTLDCLECVGTLSDLRAMVLHLSHVAHLVGLLHVAQGNAEVRPARHAEAHRPTAQAWQAPR